MSVHLEVVPNPPAAGAISPRERRTVLPHECAEGYAEQLLGGYVARRIGLSREMFGELLRAKQPLSYMDLVGPIAERLGEKVNEKLRKRVYRARARIGDALPGILQEDTDGLQIVPAQLRALRLDEEGLGEAVFKSKSIARDRINRLWYERKDALLQRLSEKYELEDGEYVILKLLFNIIKKGIKLTDDRGSFLSQLVSKLPIGYIRKSEDTFYAGHRAIEEMGGFLRR